MQKSRKNAHLNFTIGTNEFCDYSTMLDTDTVLARKRAAFALKRAYEIDSAFVWMEGAQLTEFLDSIRLVIREEIARIR